MRSDRKRRGPGLIISGIAVLLAALIAGGGWLWLSSGAAAVDPGDTQPVMVTIPGGAGTDTIAAALAENGLIGSVAVFKLQSRLKGFDGQYKTGSYELSRSMSMIEIMEKIASGDASTVRFTVPEGYTVAQTRDKLVQDGLVNADEFMENVAGGEFSYRFLEGLPAGEDRLEGYLYPETYDVYVNAGAHDIINRMLSQFDSLFTEDLYRQAQAAGLSVHEVVTIASLIERETKVAEERVIVASVIYNRLERGMKLQIDATVQYALGEQKERLLYRDLEIDSPYNTYRIEGLPPGPICSPRIECVIAALNPADTDYLYYVLKPELNGEHNFTADYEQFEAYKRQYLNAL